MLIEAVVDNGAVLHTPAHHEACTVLCKSVVQWKRLSVYIVTETGAIP